MSPFCAAGVHDRGRPDPDSTAARHAALFAERQADRYDMHSRHLNEQMVRVLRTIGYDVQFCRGTVNIYSMRRARAVPSALIATC